MASHFIEFEDFKNYTVQQFIAHLDQLEGIKLSELKVKDLSYSNGNIVTPGEGVYLFRQGAKVVLVGKNSSNSFTERISKHFDVRTFAWFNRLLQLVSWKLLDIHNPDFYLKASNYCFDNLNLILINFQKRDKINRMEWLLRATTNPLNQFKHEKNVDMNKMIKEF